MAQSKTSMTFGEGMKLACSVITDLIKGYAEKKYDDYEYRHLISSKERLNNEFARDVIDNLLKFLEESSDKFDEKLNEVVAEPKENEDVGTDGNGTVSAEAVHTSRKRSEKEVPKIHTGLSKA